MSSVTTFWSKFWTEILWNTKQLLLSLLPEYLIWNPFLLFYCCHQQPRIYCNRYCSGPLTSGRIVFASKWKPPEQLTTFSREFDISKEILCNSHLMFLLLCFSKGIKYDTQLRASQFVSKSTGSSSEVCPDGISISDKCFSLHRDLKQHSKVTRRVGTLQEQRALWNHKNWAIPAREPAIWTAPNYQIKLSEPHQLGPELIHRPKITSYSQPPVLSPGPNPNLTSFHAFTDPLATTLLHLGKHLANLN